MPAARGRTSATVFVDHGSMLGCDSFVFVQNPGFLGLGVPPSKTPGTISTTEHRLTIDINVAAVDSSGIPTNNILPEGDQREAEDYLKL